jgi:SAM-dependent methyltransferase
VEEPLPRERVLALYRRLGPISQDEEALFGEYRLMRCSGCDLRFAEPMRAGSPAFYDWAYRQAPYETDARWEWDALIADLAQCPPGPVLDVGCGKGGLLRKIAGATGRQVMGVDRSDAAIAACRERGIPCEQRSVVELLADPRHAASYAAVSLSHVLEHLADPVATLRQTLGLLRPGGRLYVAVPFSPQFWESEDYDPFNLPPHHLTRWNERSMRQLAATAGAQVTLRAAPPVSLAHVVRVMCAWHFGVPANARRALVRSMLAHPLATLRVVVRELTLRRPRLQGAPAGHILLAIFAAQ